MQQPEQKQGTITAVDDWTALREAVNNLSESILYTVMAPGHECVVKISDIETISEYVPKLLDAYAECFELSLAMTKAWEDWQASKDSLYVPDAEDMVQLHRDGEL